MSKRAEELARRVYDDYCGLAQPNGSVDIPEISALIDAELRKERERCAERASEHALGQGWISDSENGDGIGLRAAILSEADE